MHQEFQQRVFFDFSTVIIALALSFFLGPEASSQTSLSGLIINADDYEYDSVNKKAILTGQVQVVWNGNHLSAAKAEIDLTNKVIFAQGDVIVQNSTLHAEADRIEYDYDKETGFFYNSFIQSGQVVFEGEVIEKTGKETFVATKAKYSACETCPGAWSFSGKEIEAELGGYAWITRPILRVGGFPVLILPGIVVPLKSKRQSGFLVPSYNFSRLGGNALSQSYFWAIDRNKDMTLTARNYEKRGFMSLAEYRYVLTEKNRGKINAAHIRDKAFRDEINKEIDRWYLNYSHVFEMPDNLVHRVNFTAISDLKYPTDFPQQLDANLDPAIENSMSLTKTTENQFASVEGTYNINLLKKDKLDDNDDAVHRLPEITYNIKNQRLFGSPLIGKFELRYVNFMRNGPSYDDIEIDGGDDFKRRAGRDGVFDPDGLIDDDGNAETVSRDLIRTGHRLDMKPTLSLPFQIGSHIDVRPRVTYRETQYRFQIADDVNTTSNFSPSAARRYVQTDIMARAQFSKVYGDMQEAKSTRIRHEIEPEISFTSIPWFKRANHGFFGDFSGQPYSQSQQPITDADFLSGNKIQFDYEDRVFDQKVVSYAFTNKLVRKTWKYGQPEYQNVLLARISQSYDFNELRDTKTPQPWLPLYALVSANFENFETHTEAFHYGYADRTNFNTRMRIKSQAGDFLEVGYTNNVAISEDNRPVPPENENVLGGLGLTTKYLNIFGQMNYSLVSYKIDSWSYGLVAKPPGNCVQLIFGGTFVPNGDANFNANVLFNFGGDR